MLEDNITELGQDVRDRLHELTERETIEERLSRLVTNEIKKITTEEINKRLSTGEVLALTEDEMQLLNAYRAFVRVYPPETIFRWTTPPVTMGD